MKAVLTFLFTLVLCSCAAVRDESPEMDIVTFKNFTIMKISTGERVPFSASPQMVNNAFGAPTSSVPEYSEMDDLTYTKSIYGGLTIYFHDGDMDTFDCESAAFGLVVNNKVIKVGDHIGTLSSIFPRAYAARTNELVTVELFSNGELTDASVVFGYDESDKITFFSLVMPC